MKKKKKKKKPGASAPFLGHLKGAGSRMRA
jgi:hypothetical protein